MALCWKYKGTVIFTIIYSLVDIAVTTVLYGQGVDYHLHFVTDFYRFDLYRSLIELWVFGLVRFVVLLGGIVGFVCNPVVAVPRAACIKPAVTTLLVTMWVYTNSKLLLYVEDQTDMRQPWFWTLYAWSNIALIITYLFWANISSQKVPLYKEKKQFLIKDDVENRILVDEEEVDESSEEEGEEDKDEEEDEDEGIKDGPSSMQLVWRLLKLSLPDWYLVLPAFFFMVIAEGGETVGPYYTGQAVQAVFIDKSSSVFTNAILIICATGVGSVVAAALQTGLFELCLGRLQIRISKQLFTALMRQEVAFYDVTRTGEITSRLTSDTTTMCEALNLNIKLFIRNLFQSVIIMVFMVQLSWRLTMVTIIGFPLLLGVSEVYGEFYKKLSVKVQDSLAKVNDVAQEVCSSIRTVRSFGNERREVARYATGLKATYKLKVKEAQASGGYIGCSYFFELSLEVATLYYGGHLAIKNQLTVGHFMAFVLYRMNLGYNLELMASVYPGLMEAVGASQKVFEFIDRKPKISHEDGKLAPETMTGKLEFKDVTFTYPSRPDNPALQNVSFSVSPGEVVALVGPSGGGKSTIVSLLEHFYETDSGQVLLDGIPIKEYDHKYVHKKIALVGQEPVLYARSVQENIAYGLETSSPEEVESAAKQANAHDFISEMKKKYNTQTGEKGIQLSGGQKQRVAIARALVRNPVVLLLDEATSALDSESEHMVQEALYNNLKGRTVIIVAHRLSTVEMADRIIVINKGKVAEEGTHTELLQAGGMYAGLVKRQMLTFDASPA